MYNIMWKTVIYISQLRDEMSHCAAVIRFFMENFPPVLFIARFHHLSRHIVSFKLCHFLNYDKSLSHSTSSVSFPKKMHLEDCCE